MGSSRSSHLSDLMIGAFPDLGARCGTAWHEHRFSRTVDAFMEDGHKVGVRSVPAVGWPHRQAIVGLMPLTELVLRLRNQATE
jgi:hypothetical protein